jgi:ribosomal protein S18 acetylase RimI-like enzyme
MLIRDASADDWRGIWPNTRAVALWQSLGFQIIGTVPGAFHHPREGYVGLHVMYRPL